MPGTIQTFFATIDPGSPPPQQPPGFCLPAKSISPANKSTDMRPLSSGLLRWRRRVLPPGLPAVRSEFQRHRLSTGKPYAGSMAKDRLRSGWDLERIGAGEGNRTLVCSLGSCRSTIELRPQTFDIPIFFRCRLSAILRLFSLRDTTDASYKKEDRYARFAVCRCGSAGG